MRKILYPVIKFLKNAKGVRKIITELVNNNGSSI